MYPYAKPMGTDSVRVQMTRDKEASSYCLSPEKALELANMLIKAAEEVRKGRNDPRVLYP
jgi:hypothetical protein